MTSALEQFVAFGTDIVGLERLLRLLQAILLVLTAYPSLLSRVLILLPLSPFLASQPVTDVVSTAASLLQLQTQLNLVRRTIRLFWFLASFQSSWALFAAHDKGVDAWLGVLAQSASGMFGLMESLTLLDLAGAGVTLFGRVEAARLDHEAQMLWLVALYASALGSASKLLAVLAHRPVPPTGNGFGAALDGRRGVAAADEGTKGEKREAKEYARKREVHRRRAEAGTLGSKLLADLLDTAIPASRPGVAQRRQRVGRHRNAVQYRAHRHDGLGPVSTPALRDDGRVNVRIRKGRGGPIGGVFQAYPFLVVSRSLPRRFPVAGE